MRARCGRELLAPSGTLGTVSVRVAAIALLTATLLAVVQPSAMAETPVVDGEIGEAEYDLHVSLGNGHLHLYWSFIDNDTIQFGVRAQASGMVAIGLDPTVRMKDADMVLGWREGTGDFELHDAWSVGETGPHPDDVDEGGTFDLLEYTAREEGGVTTMEFTRLLVTNDSLDREVPREGKVKLIWATSDTDAFETYHTRRGTATIDMGTGEFESVEYPTLWPYHAIFMSLAMVFFAATWFSVVHKKRFKQRFLMTHHSLGSIGVLSAVIGLGLGIYMVAQLESGHIRITHSIFAVLDLVLGISALAVGQVFMSRKELKRPTRRPHIWLGGLAIVFMALVVLLGLVYVFPV